MEQSVFQLHSDSGALLLESFVVYHITCNFPSATSAHHAGSVSVLLCVFCASAGRRCLPLEVGISVLSWHKGRFAALELLCGGELGALPAGTSQTWWLFWMVQMPCFLPMHISLLQKGWAVFLCFKYHVQMNPCM